MKPFCAAVDWGTSSFRLWILDVQGVALKERRSNEGIMNLGGRSFMQVLEDNLAAIGADADLPVVVGGMAGSRQGWKEAGYIDTPAALDSLISHSVVVTESQRAVHILPGIAQRSASEPDVMRGEEVQLLGIPALSSADALACMPGTHSKWVELSKGRVVHFRTYLTGELYAAVSRNTILRHAIVESEFDKSAFRAALPMALEAPGELTASLFSLRAAQLLGFAASGTAAAQVSALLIGSEVASVTRRHGAGRAVDLIASGSLAGLYGLALEMAGHNVQMHDAMEASRAGLWTAARKIFAGSLENRKTG